MSLAMEKGCYTIGADWPRIGDTGDGESCAVRNLRVLVVSKDGWSSGVVGHC